MDEPSEHIKKFLIFFILGVIILKGASSAGIFIAKSYKGSSFVVPIPAGWEIVKKQKGVIYPQGVAVAMFVPKGTDLTKKGSITYISILTKKLSSSLWIEDEFPDILLSINQDGHQIMDKGEIKIDGEISKWVVYHDLKTPALVLEFYMVTDNNTFFKIQYSAHPDQFNTARRSFEEMKENFKFRFSLF